MINKSIPTIHPEAQEIIRKFTLIINEYSLGEESNTPDFILANYLFTCLTIFNMTTIHRTKLLRLPSDKE